MKHFVLNYQLTYYSAAALTSCYHGTNRTHGLMREYVCACCCMCTCVCVCVCVSVCVSVCARTLLFKTATLTTIIYNCYINTVQKRMITGHRPVIRLIVSFSPE